MGEVARNVGGIGPVLGVVVPPVAEAVIGVIAGAIVLAAVTLGSRLISGIKRQA
jgi:predicted DNA repair protein MutK